MYPEVFSGRFRRGSLEAIQAVLGDEESAAGLIRIAVEREVARRRLAASRRGALRCPAARPAAPVAPEAVPSPSPSPASSPASLLPEPLPAPVAGVVSLAALPSLAVLNRTLVEKPSVVRAEVAQNTDWSRPAPPPLAQRLAGGQSGLEPERSPSSGQPSAAVAPPVRPVSDGEVRTNGASARARWRPRAADIF